VAQSKRFGGGRDQSFSDCDQGKVKRSPTLASESGEKRRKKRGKSRRNFFWNAKKTRVRKLGNGKGEVPMALAMEEKKGKGGFQSSRRYPKEKKKGK